MATLKTTIRTPSVVRTIVRGMGRPGESGAATPIAARSLLGNANNATALPVGISDPAVLQSIVQCPSEAEYDAFVSLVGATFTAVDIALAARVLNTDGRLTDSREWTASTISQAEAEAGTATNRRAFTAQRVRQAAEALNVERGVYDRAGYIYDHPEGNRALECSDSEWIFGSTLQRDNLLVALRAVGTTFETVNNNLQSLPHTINRTGGRISSIVYTLPDASTITKTINRTGDEISSIVLSGATPAGIQLTKTITRTGGVITGVSYS